MQYFQLTTYDEIIKTLKPNLPENIQQSLQRFEQSTCRLLTKQLEGSLFLALLENIDYLFLDSIIKQLKLNPFYQSDIHNTQLIFLYRSTMVRLTQFTAKIKSCPEAKDEALDQFYKQTISAINGLGLAYQALLKQSQTPFRLFEKYGLSLIICEFIDGQYKYLRSDKDNTRVIIMIRDGEKTFGLYQNNSKRSKKSLSSSMYSSISMRSLSSSTSSFNKPKQYSCSVCNVQTSSLFKNIFCKHLYCKICLIEAVMILDPNRQSYKCPKRDCTSRIIRSLIMDQNMKYGDVLNESLQQITSPTTATTLPQSIRIKPNQSIILPHQPQYKPPPMINNRSSVNRLSFGQPLRNDKIGTYQKEQQNKIKELQNFGINDNNNSKSNYPTATQLINQPIQYCGQCLMALEPTCNKYVNAQCFKHFICFSCEMAKQIKCIQCV